jgi:alkylation response protein AidB-like acyl-CoA dehydrogenase
LRGIAGTTAGDSAGPVERIARIAGLIERSAAAGEALGRLMPEVVDSLHEQRLLRLLLPRAYGEEIDAVTWFRAMEALARLDASTAWCVGQINGCAVAASALALEAARKIWDDPRAVLSWGPPKTARADEVDGGHRVSGEWTLSSGSRHATWLGLMAPVFDRRGACVGPAGAGIRIFLAPASGAEWVDNWDAVGLKATNSGGYRFKDQFVPDGYSVSRNYLPEVRLAGPLYKFPLNALFAIGFSAVALGIARSMLDAVIALAKQKRPWLSKQSLLESHLVQFQIGEAEARLRSARGYVESTAGQVWEAVVASGELTADQRIAIRMAATFAIHEAGAVADVAWQIAGANAIFASGPFERRLRDIRTVMQQAQGRKSHLQDAGAYLLGLAPNFAYA